jgi:hypothetical protein
LQAATAGTIARVESSNFVGSGVPVLAVGWTTAASPTSGSSTLIGETAGRRGSESQTQAVARATASYGKMSIFRAFNTGLPASWSTLNATYGGTPLVVSFKANPTDITSGKDDGFFRAWFASAPKDRIDYWSYYHEPEDNIAAGEFTAAAYRAAWVHLRSLANEAGNAKLKSALILMAYSLEKVAHRTWTDYYPGSATIDVLVWDSYSTLSKPAYLTPAQLFGPALSASTSAGKPFAIAEFGAVLAPGDNGANRAAWLTSCESFLKQNHAVFATYFDAIGRGDWRLLDSPSVAAMHKAVTGG